MKVLPIYDNSIESYLETYQCWNRIESTREISATDSCLHHAHCIILSKGIIMDVSLMVSEIPCHIGATTAIYCMVVNKSLNK